jgi:hypothetical protein
MCLFEWFGAYRDTATIRVDRCRFVYHNVAMLAFPRFLRTALPLLALPLVVACTGVTDPAPGDDGAPEIGETSDAVTGRPNYSRRNTSLLGMWSGSDHCPGGFDLCTDARIDREPDGSWSITLGPAPFGSDLKIPLRSTNGVFVFSTGDAEGVPGHDDCQDPGCGDVLKVSGVLYAKKVGTEWVPTLKVSLVLQFSHPDEEDAPEGEVRHTGYMTHAP